MADLTNTSIPPLKIKDKVEIQPDFFINLLKKRDIKLNPDIPVRGVVTAVEYVPADTDDDTDDEDVFFHITIDITDNDPKVQYRKPQREQGPNDNFPKLVRDENNKPLYEDKFSDLDMVIIDEDDLPYVKKVEGGGEEDADARPNVQSNREDAEQDASEKQDVRGICVFYKTPIIQLMKGKGSRYRRLLRSKDEVAPNKIETQSN